MINLVQPTRMTEDELWDWYWSTREAEYLRNFRWAIERERLAYQRRMLDHAVTVCRTWYPDTAQAVEKSH